MARRIRRAAGVINVINIENTPEKQYGNEVSARGVKEELVALVAHDVGKHMRRERGKVEKVMGEFKSGELHSGSKKGPKVTSRRQAVAIAMSEQRKAAKGKY